VAAILVDIVSAEGPIHADEALRVLAEQFDTKASVRSREAFQRGLSAAISSARFDIRVIF